MMICSIAVGDSTLIRTSKEEIFQLEAHSFRGPNVFLFFFLRVTQAYIPPSYILNMKWGSDADLKPSYGNFVESHRQKC